MDRLGHEAQRKQGGSAGIGVVGCKCGARVCEAPQCGLKGWLV